MNKIIRKLKKRADGSWGIETGEDRNLISFTKSQPAPSVQKIAGKVKQSEWLDICKSIANGHDQGLTSRQIYLTMNKIALARYADEPLSPEKKFCKLLASESGKIM